MIEPLTSNTQAILLLTAPLIAGRGEASHDLLTLGEYNKLARILREKQMKRPAHPAPVKPSAENVVNLMDALRRSISAEKGPAAKSASRRSAAKSRRIARVRKA